MMTTTILIRIKWVKESSVVINVRVAPPPPPLLGYTTISQEKASWNFPLSLFSKRRTIWLLLFRCSLYSHHRRIICALWDMQYAEENGMLWRQWRRLPLYKMLLMMMMMSHFPSHYVHKMHKCLFILLRQVCTLMIINTIIILGTTTPPL